MSASIRQTPYAYTVLAIALANGDIEAAAVSLLAAAVDDIAAKEDLPRAQALTQEETRRPARQHQRA